MSKLLTFKQLYPREATNWSKAFGPHPTSDQLAIAHAFTARPGKQALAMACALRSDGVTRDQMSGISAANDGKATFHANKIDQQVKAGVFTRNPAFKGWQLSLTPRGRAFMKQAVDGKANKLATAPDATPVKAAKAKPRMARKPRQPKAPAPAAVEAPAAAATGGNGQQG